MGAWGYGALESDPSYDWMYEAMGPTVTAIDEALRASLKGRAMLHNAATLRAAAYLLERVGYEGVYPNIDVGGFVSRFDTDSLLEAHLRLAIDKLGVLLRGDYAEEGGWDDPDALRSAIRAQIDILKRRLQDPSAPRNETLLSTVEGFH